MKDLGPNKIILTICAMLLLCSDVSAQQVEFGVKGGLVNTKFVGDSDPQFDAISSSTAGITFSFWINQHVTFEIEALYTFKGSTTQTDVQFFEDETPVLTNLAFDLTYLEIPVLGRYSFMPQSAISPTVQLGSYIGTKNDSYVRYQAASGGPEFRETDDSIKSVDYGFLAGVGVDYNFNFHTLRLDARYSRGIANLIQNSSDPKYNGQWTLTIGFEY